MSEWHKANVEGPHERAGLIRQPKESKEGR